VNEARRERIKDLHGRAIEMEPAERERFLAGECGEDSELRDEVESLLGAHDGMGEFLAVPALERLPDLLSACPAFSPGDRIESYEVIEELGEGGTGTVYVAMQARPRRHVAVKVLRAGLDSEAAVRRFQDESELLARLNHPDVATVYEAGVAQVEGVDLPWFAMEFVPGARTVLEHAESEELSVRARLELVARIAMAIHHGHQKGIVHLDIKPGNLLVSEAGRLKVIDFGIARVAGVGDSTDHGVAGTLSYMSPEQCEPGRVDVDVRSDVYALGVLLYELLTGRLPLDVAGDSLSTALDRIREESPPAPSRIRRSLRGDPDCIVRKALAKDREQRYASAAALADDLRRHLEYEPVEAHPRGLLYQMSRFARRRRGAFLAIAAVVLISIAAAVTSGVLALAKEQQRREAEFQAYVANIAAAAAALRMNDVAEARQCLDRAPDRRRGWEWHHLFGRTDTSIRTLACQGLRVGAGAISPDEALVTVCGTVPQGPYRIQTREVESGKVLYDLRLTDSAADALQFGPEGERLVVGLRDGSLELRASRTGDLVWSVKAHESFVNVVVFDPSGECVATGGRDGTIKLWSAEAGEPRMTLTGHEDRVIGLDFDPAGDRLASGGREGAVRIWDARTGAPIAVFTGHGGSVEAVAWSPDGRRVASVGRDQTLRIWDVESGRAIAVGRGHTENVRDVAVSPDGQVVATASYDGSVRLWAADDAHPLVILRGHQGLVKRVCFDRTGHRVVSFSHDGTVKFWDATRRGEVPELRGHREVVLAIAFSPDGRRLVSGCRDGTARVWDLASGRTTSTIVAGKRPVNYVAFRPDGRSVLTGTFGERVRSWSIPEQELLREFKGTWGSCFAVDGNRGRVYVGHYQGDLLATDMDTGEPLGRWPVHRNPVQALALSPGGRTLASGSMTGAFRLTSLPDMQSLASTEETGIQVEDLAIGPRGRWLAAALRNGEIVLLDAKTLGNARTLRGHLEAVQAVAFSPDGRRIASASLDNTVRLWDVETARQVAVLHGHGNHVWSVAWSADGRRLASGGGYAQDWTSSAILLWEAP